jgi:hypothetical protein
MKTRTAAFALAAALATSAACAGEAAPKPVQPTHTVPRTQTLVQDLAAGAREILRAVTPEISLPAVELKLPTLDARGR